MKLRLFLPLAVFMIMAGFLVRGLSLDPSRIPSPLIGKEAPEFRLTQLDAGGAEFNSADMVGQVWILNIWASWCVACRDEHPLFLSLSEQGLLPIVGLNYKDKVEDASLWLDQFGNPYSVIAHDGDGRVGIDWGVYGVPETFVIDRAGKIRYKHIGPVDQKALVETILPMINSLLDSPA